MTHTHELRVHRRAHRLNQEELAHLLGVTPSMLLRMEQGAKAQLADIETMLGLEVVFGKSPSQIFSALYAAVEEAVMRRATDLEAIWRTLDDGKAKANLALLEKMMARVPVTPDAA
jgi:transcriptional regulator with XRE-family HTH domain